MNKVRCVLHYFLGADVVLDKPPMSGIEERRAAAFHDDVGRCTELRFSASQRASKNVTF